MEIIVFGSLHQTVHDGVGLGTTDGIVKQHGIIRGKERLK